MKLEARGGYAYVIPMSGVDASDELKEELVQLVLK